MDMIKRALIVMLFFTPIVAVAEEDEDGSEEEQEGGFKISGEANIGFKYVEQNRQSSKFNEYKDNETEPYLNRLVVDAENSETGQVFGLIVNSLDRDDQEIFLEYGNPERFVFDFHLDDIPHSISDNAKTPYEYLGAGAYRVDNAVVDAIQISDVANAASWTAVDAGPGAGGEDVRISSVLSENVHDVRLGTERRDITLGFQYKLSKQTNMRLEFDIDTKKGRRVIGASIGDRPSRSMTVQLPEPIDYRNESIKLSMEHIGEQYQLDATYQYEQFENKVELLSWNSLFYGAGYFGSDGDPATLDGGSDYDSVRIGTSAQYATIGRIALEPDNSYENLIVNLGVNLPMKSRFNVTLSMGEMEQDENLLPYASSDFGGSLDDLPRSGADAKIDTKMLNLLYAIRPIRNLNARVYYRYYDLDNKTQQSEFYYYTQDTSSEDTSTDIARDYRNERVNLAYDYRRNAYGLDLSYYLGKYGTLGFVAEKEIKKRENRATDKTDEQTLTLSYRARPIDTLSFKVKYVQAERDAGKYDGEVTDLSYHYDTTLYAGESASPVSGFGNNPGLRQYDITDRDKDQFDLTLGFLPIESLAINLAYQQQQIDYKSKIASQLTSWDSSRSIYDTVSIDPTQLGLIKEVDSRIVLDLNYQLNEEMLIYGFLSNDMIETDQRGRYMDQNEKIDNILAQRDWSDRTGVYVWNADLRDETNTIGIGLDYIVKETYEIRASLMHSRAVVDIRYKPGAAIAENNQSSELDQAEWYSPPDVRFTNETFNLQFAKHLSKNSELSFSYTLEQYNAQDWQQLGTAAHNRVFNGQYVANNDVETIGTERDQVGSRLVMLSNNLTPDYRVHIIEMRFAYKW